MRARNEFTLLEMFSKLFLSLKMVQNDTKVQNVDE